MNFYVGAALINFVTSLVFCLAVFIRNPRNKINYSYALYAFDVAIWSLCYYFWQISQNAEDALFWSKALMAFAIFIPAFYSHFVFVFTGLTNRKVLFLILSYLLLGAFLPFDIFGSLFIQEVKPLLSFPFWPIAGPLFSIFLSIWIGIVLFDTYLLYKAYINATGIYKNQIKYVFWGLALAFTGGITNYFLWYEIPIPPFANILVSAYVGLTAIAIVRHRLMDFKLVLARSIAYVILLFLIGIFYTGGLFLSSTYIIKQETSTLNLVISTILTLFVAFTFQSLKGMLERFTDRIFYHSRYDENQVLSILSHIMSTNIEIRPLISQTLQSILKEMKIARGALILKNSGGIYEIVSEGFNQQLNAFNCRFAFSLDVHRIVVFDDLDEGTLKESMRNLRISIIKVLHINNDVVGLLVLGEKSSGEMYSEQDLKVFDILSPELSVAIQNAESYDKIKRFNITLGEEVKKATIDLQSANSRLKELDRLKNDFVSIASHELRTPMTAIRSYLWMAIKRPDVPLSAKMEKYLSRAYISTERLINLVNDMLNVSRIESGSIEIKPKEFDIQSIADEIVSMVLPKANEKNIKIEVIKNKIPTVFADPDKVTQVLLNLLGNALKFTSADGKISISFFSDGKVVETSIRDNGVGISREDLPKLFQKFGRLDNSYAAAATSGGTGLGLFISKSLIDLMHGKIWAISEGTGKGSIFTFSLPVLTPEVLANAEHYSKKPVGEAKELQQVMI